jgi:hypothetical protein
MLLKSLTFLAVILSFSCNQVIQSERTDKLAIRNIMEKQAHDWSNNNIDAFMEAYHNTDSIIYFGANGIRKGYSNMLKSYRERYPTKAHTGSLNFDLKNITRISEDAYWVMGEYHLVREVGDASGVFMVIFKRINSQWKIVADTSC